MANPLEGVSRLAWGFASKGEEKENDSDPEDVRQYEGLLCHRQEDYQLLLAPSGDPEYPDNLTISTTFEESFGLPCDDVRKLYNVLQCLNDGTRLRIIPDDQSIAVCGVNVSMPLENVNGRLLHDALFRLSISSAMALSWLSKNEGDDYWRTDGGR